MTRDPRVSEPGDAAGRHAWPDVPPTRRTGHLLMWKVLSLVAAVVVGVVVVRTATAGGAAQSTCSGGRRTLAVSAAPEIAKVLTDATGQGIGRLLPKTAQCLDVRVTAQPAADVSAALQAGRAGSDLWVPDSSAWLGTAGLPTPLSAITSLATSPVVLAVDRSIAERLGWPAVPLDLAGSLTADGSGRQRLGLPRPDRSAASQLGLLEVSQLLGRRADARSVITQALRTADSTVPEDPQEALQRLPHDLRLAVPVPEQSVWARAASVGSPVAVGYYPPTASVLDFPLVRLNVRTPDADLTALRQALATPAWSERVRAAGFRAADGTAGPALSREHGVDGQAATHAQVPAATAVQQALRNYEVLVRGMRMLAVLDVSGSMATQVPGTDGQTRMDLASAAAARGLGLLGDDAEVGLWTFSTSLTPTSDHRELAGIGRLGVRDDGSSGRETLARALADVREVPTGDTGLYDTALDAVRAVRADWDPARVNSVVLITDGRNDDPHGISLDTLLTRLRAEAADRPVPIIGIAYGPDGDVGALREISRVTGGSVYESQDPRHIGDVLQDALAQRLCRPGC